jgi:uncharacterized membrane protein
LPSTPQLFALVSAICSAIATLLIQRGLRRSNFYAGFWINVAVGSLGLWLAVLLFVRSESYDWRAVPYFVFSGVVGTAAGRLFRVVAIERVGAPVAASILNLTPLIATGFAIVLLGERVTGTIVAGTLVIVAGTVLLSFSGRYIGFQPKHLIYPFLGASCFGVVQVARKLGLSHAGPVFDAALNTTAAMIAATAFVVATGHWRAIACDRVSLLYFTGGGVAENTSVLLAIVALGFGDVSVVAPLAGTAPLFVLLLTCLFPSARQHVSWRVVVGVGLIVLGISLITGVKSVG